MGVVNIKHTLSEDGLLLISSAFVNGALVSHSTRWLTEEAAEDRYYMAIHQAEAAFRAAAEQQKKLSRATIFIRVLRPRKQMH